MSGSCVMDDVSELERRADLVSGLIRRMSFEECQAEILGRLVELGVPELLIDLSRHPELCEVNAHLRRKWNVAFLLSAIGSLMGVSIRLTDPSATQSVDSVVAYEYVTRIIADADGALCELRKYEAFKDATHFERLLRPYRDMAKDLGDRAATL